MEDYDKLFSLWEEKESKNLSRKSIGKEETKAKRSYIHFDQRRQASSLSYYRSIFKYPANIVKNPFWPFLKRNLTVIKIKNSKDGKPRKKKIKTRTVYYASHQNALVYSWYSFLLNEKFYKNKIKELGIEKCVIAYRQIPLNDGSKGNKSNIHSAKEVFDYIKNNSEECVAFVSDITGFFDNLDHEHLRLEWLKVLGLSENENLPADHSTIYKNLTRFKYVDADEVYEKFGIEFKREARQQNGKTKVFRVPRAGGHIITSILDKPFSKKDFVTRIVKQGLIKGNENKNPIKKCSCGIMQGSPISATLSNIYMMSFDKNINDLVTKASGIYRRYSDDIVVVCKKSDYEELKNKVKEEIKKYELVINDDKTDTTYFLNDGKGNLTGFSNKMVAKKMQYLGFDFDGINSYIRSNSLAKYYRKMKSVTRKAVSMAYGKKSKTKDNDNKIFKKNLYKRYLFKGRRSFISYALRADKILGGNTIKKQLKKRFKIMSNYIQKKTTR